MKKMKNSKLAFLYDGTDEQCIIIQKALNYLPKEVVEYFRKNPITIYCEKNDSVGHFFHEKSFTTKIFIILSWHLWEYNKETIIFSILHEMAHAYKNHQGEDKNKHETEANNLSNRWIEKYHNKSIRKKYWKKD
jgi:hypothetical protein